MVFCKWGGKSLVWEAGDLERLDLGVDGDGNGDDSDEI